MMVIANEITELRSLGCLMGKDYLMDVDVTNVLIEVSAVRNTVLMTMEK